MKTKPYKAKSLSGAQSRVRQLQNQVSIRDVLLTRFSYERKLLAMLSADTPQFHNPLAVMEAKQIRDRVLKNP